MLQNDGCYNVDYSFCEHIFNISNIFNVVKVLKHLKTSEIEFTEVITYVGFRVDFYGRVPFRHRWRSVFSEEKFKLWTFIFMRLVISHF